jgi:hypothetical protein
MTEVAIVGDRLRVRLSGWDRVWALKREIEVPLSQVRSVEPAPPGLHPRGLRAPGSHLPGVITAGTYRRRSGKEFWSVRSKSRAVVIDLAEGASYDRLVLQVPDPNATLNEIRRVIGQPVRS